ncbi:MAG: hypothetical protein VXW43_03675 [Pseudomonadota bacterium]|nr:hypothetical protein [Pseudomonadota bacterium]
MTKHEKSFTELSASDQNLDERVEAALRAFKLENDGRMPKREELNKVVRTSHTRLGPSFLRVRDKIESMATRLSSMPEIPVELRAASEKALEEMWAMTRDLQNAEIVELRRSQEARDARQRSDLADLQAVIAGLEVEIERLRSDLSQGEEVVQRQQAEITDLSAKLAEEIARQAERGAILELLGLKADAEKPEPRKAVGKTTSTDTGGGREPKLDL